MPRLRVVKKPEDSAKVPLEQAVAVELAPEGNELESKEIEQEIPETVEVAPVKAEEQKPDEAITLKKQLEDLERANKDILARATEQERLHREAVKRAEDAEKKATEVGGRAEQAEFDSVLNAIGAASTELESAKRDLRTAGEAGNWEDQADAQARIAQAAGRLMQLEDGKAALEARQERQKKEAETRKEEPARQPATVEEYVDSLPGLIPTERTWLKAHPELLTDKRKNIKLQDAYFEAEDAKHARGTEAYFTFLEEKLGYKKPPKSTEPTESEEEETPPMVSAPVSRESISPSSGKATSTRITLSPSQREAARLSGVDELTYAKNLQKLNELKKDGHYVQN